MSNAYQEEVPFPPVLLPSLRQLAREELFVHNRPPMTLLECASCGSRAGKHCLCAKCGWQRYCSRDCQQADWKAHKKLCKKNRRVDLTVFQAFIACLACLANTCRETETSQDINRHARIDIVNKPDATMKPTVFPDGYAAKIVQLRGAPRSLLRSPRYDLENWWPLGENNLERLRLLQRLQDEISPSQLHLAIALTLLAELYLSPAGSSTPLTTLRVAASPVSDFGLAFGSCPGRPENCYAYEYLEGPDTPSRDVGLQRGADPAKHVWLYFRTADGNEYYLDLALNIFGLGTFVEAQPFWQGQGEEHTFVTDHVGMFWFDKRLYPEGFSFYREVRRRSILRSDEMAQVCRYLMSWQEDTMPKRLIPSTIADFIGLLVGEEMLLGEALGVMKWIVRSMRRTRRVVDGELWQSWPTSPSVFAAGESGDNSGPGIPMDPIDRDAFVDRAKKFASRSRRAASRERRHM